MKIIQQELLTERLRLVPVTPDHAEHYYVLMNTEAFKANIADRNIHSVEAAREYIVKLQSGQGHIDEYYNHTIFRRSDDVFLGHCGLFKRKGLEDMDIGYSFLPEYHGFGYAFEGASRIRDLAFEQGVTKLTAITLVTNRPSRKLLTKLGFGLVGKTALPDDPAELLLYEKINPNV